MLNEQAPTAGGIFVSSLDDPLHELKSLVSSGVTKVGDCLNSVFRSVGEALSFDGTQVGFWGSWGASTRDVTVRCSANGNAAIKAACLAQDDNGTTGLYGDFSAGIDTLLETGMDGALVDANAVGMKITSIGVERDGLRNGWLAINAGMANADATLSMSGVYLAQIPEPPTGALLALAFAAIGLGTRRRRVAAPSSRADSTSSTAAGSATVCS